MKTGNMDIYLSTAYLAPVEYYSKYIPAKRIIIEQYENYRKQSYRNRCRIVSANGVISLSIPVEHSSKEKILTKDIRIAAHGNWQHVHWNAIVSAYNSTPFFEYYRDDFFPFYHKEYSFLFDFNEELNHLISGLLNIDLPPIEYTCEYRQSLKEGEADYRDTIHPKIDWQKNNTRFSPYPYYQVFGQRFGFIPNMSIIDLLFNMGNESLIILANSHK